MGFVPKLSRGSHYMVFEGRHAVEVHLSAATLAYNVSALDSHTVTGVSDRRLRESSGFERVNIAPSPVSRSMNPNGAM